MIDKNKLTSKHTPGPWHISVPTHVGIWAGFNTMQGQCIGIYATNDDLECIAQVPKDEVLQFKEQDNLANAHLISAAPEAIEFVADFLERVDKRVNGVIVYTQEDMDKLISTAESILKKAYNF